LCGGLGRLSTKESKDAHGRKLGGGRERQREGKTQGKTKGGEKVGGEKDKLVVFLNKRIAEKVITGLLTGVPRGLRERKFGSRQGYAWVLGNRIVDLELTDLSTDRSGTNRARKSQNFHPGETRGAG